MGSGPVEVAKEEAELSNGAVEDADAVGSWMPKMEGE